MLSHADKLACVEFITSINLLKKAGVECVATSDEGIAILDQVGQFEQGCFFEQDHQDLTFNY